MPDSPTTDNPAPTPLFRQQALDSVRHKLHGEILLARPLSFSALTFLFAGIAVGIVVFFTFFGYTRNAQVPGLITPTTGIARVVAGQAGTIVERCVEEGQTVQAGTTLFVLSSERASATRGAAEGSISALMEMRRENWVAEREQAIAQGRQRAAATARRARDLATETGRIAGQMALQERRVDLAQQALKRYKELADVSFISKAQLQDKTADLIDQQQRLHDLERAKAAVERDLAYYRDLLSRRS